MPSNLRIDPERLWSTLMETGAIGATAKGGINRQTLTAADAAVRTWFQREAETLGCSVTVDEIGNMFALRAGRQPGLAPIALGSHLDTQPTGGKFDGNLGVLGALEALRTLVSAGYETNAPIVVVNWTNEEGARFAPAMLGSGVFAGVYSRASADAIADSEGIRFGTALDAIGWRGETKAGTLPLSAYLELHIEQGPILEAEEKTIGVVTGVQGVRWYELKLSGRESHAGTTPMPRRADALLASAHLISAVRDLALAYAPTAVGTVGQVEVAPNSPNVVPGQVRMTVDLRHHDDAILEAMETALKAAVDRAAAAEKVQITLRKLHDLAAITFHPTCIAAVRSAARALGYSERDIISGAGHDAVHLSRITPSAMIFVPCKDGLSHNEAESATREHCAAGAQVLLEAALAIDAQLASGPL
ncbi:MAG TPA: Zn-dependent hydrolase [Hyphomicrobiaceae bacterium]|nr:Zn-dependent hydrolase [Hyphomicrobiaceae bacterium]